MLMIRLSRAGRANLPHYSIVVTEKSNPASDGNFLEKVGIYTPTGKTPVFNFNKERIEHWISKGAHPTETLARLLHKQGLKGMDRFVDLKKKFSIKSDKEVPAQAPASEAPAPAAAATEAPAA